MPLTEPQAEVVVTELADNLQRVAARVPQRNRGQAGAVEGAGFHHGVVGHVEEGESLTDF